MQCTNCGNEVPESAKVCGHCGYKFKGAGLSQAQQIPMTPSGRNVPGWVWGAGGALLMAIIVAILAATGIIGMPDNGGETDVLPATTAAQPVTAVVSAEDSTPDSRILFLQYYPGGGSDVFVMDNDGRNVVQLTRDGLSGSSVWSADQSRIAFTTSRNGENKILIMDANGQNITQLSDQAGSEFDPAWSPDQNRVAFVSAESGYLNIYVVGSQGGNKVRLTNSETSDMEPTWSPDGQRIAFRRCSSGDCGIFVMDADGRNLLQLYDYPDTWGGYDSLDWSPDGSRIVFSSNSTKEIYGDIFVMDADGRNVTQLTNSSGNYSNAHPVWSPDGKHIAFASQLNGIHYDIYVMDADGTNLLRLTQLGGDSGSLDWPDW